MKITIVMLLVLYVTQALGQTEAVRKKTFNVKNKIAIGGYDPVSYFEGHPKEGGDNLRDTYKGITYLFASTFFFK